jgi:hypothetical protein
MKSGEAIWKDVVIVIPSYKRAETIQNKTLAVLKDYKIPADKIHIFVADKEQEKEYKAAVPRELYGAIHVGRPGLGAVRNEISAHYPVGKPIVECDDDITAFLEYSARARRNEKKLDDLKSVIIRGFEECQAVSCRLWGVYPIPNGFFMKPGVSTDLKFCIGSFWGWWNPGVRAMKIDNKKGEKEDYERTLKMFFLDGAVVRLNYVAPKTAYYKEAGGLQAFEGRVERQEAYVKELMERYPNWIRRNPGRKSGYPEIRLVDPRSKEQKEGREGLPSLPSLPSLPVSRGRASTAATKRAKKTTGGGGTRRAQRLRGRRD